LRGVLLIVGAPDTGKSTFAQWLSDRLTQAGKCVALLDGDVGQNALGPPTTLTLALPSGTRKASQEFQSLIHWFVGDVSPRGRMLPLVVGAGRLTRRALEARAEVVVVNTTGLVDPGHGGVALKHALVDQLQPTTLFAFQRASELQPILAPLRRLSHWPGGEQSQLRVVELPVSGAVRRRGVEARRTHRADAFRRYFAGARTLRLSLRGRAVFDGRIFSPRRLLALQDVDGFALALGVVIAYDERRDELEIRTPLAAVDDIVSIRLGVIGVDVATGHEFRPGRHSQRADWGQL
jgi:polynucleotide 5'-hydroxyl-kinase GRC3/NOL9